MPGRARTRRLQCRARAVLIWGLLCYAVLDLLPLVLLQRSTEWPWHHIGTALESRKWTRLRQLVAETPDRPLLLMLGSSRACWAFRAGDLDGMPDSDGRPLRAYNFGVPETGPIYELLYVRDLLAEGIHPRYLLIEVNPPLLCDHYRGTLNEEEMIGTESLDTRRFLQWLPYFHRPARRVSIWLSARLTPWYTFRPHLIKEAKYLAKGQSKPTYDAVDDWGWHIPLFNTFPESLIKPRQECEYRGYYPLLTQFRLAEKPTQALHELLDLCRRENIPAALVIMPESSRLRSWYSAEAKLALHGLLADLSRTYGVAVIDANTWLADEDLEDGQHTLERGAAIFTARLRTELSRLLVQSKARTSD